MIALHVDVDNLWVYEKEFNIRIHKNREYIYTQSLPLLLNLLKKSRSHATFMIIGQDLALPACQAFCRRAMREGHEIGNHTWSHPISFGKISFEEKKREIEKTHKKIIEICGISPIGFRGAGYYQDQEITSILKELKYQYDSSVVPGFAQILMTAYAYLKGGENRHKTFGRIQYVLNPNNPHNVKGQVKNQELLELPISVLPFVRLPIHTTFAYFFGSEYRKLILTRIKSRPHYFLYLFHAIDFVDLAQSKNHPVIPLRYSFEERLNFMQNVLDSLVQANKKPLQTSKVNLKSIPH